MVAARSRKSIRTVQENGSDEIARHKCFFFMMKHLPWSMAACMSASTSRPIGDDGYGIKEVGIEQLNAVSDGKVQMGLRYRSDLMMSRGG